MSEDKLGECYASRSFRKRKALPDHVAVAVFALIGGELSQTTALLIPFDSGLATAVIR